MPNRQRRRASRNVRFVTPLVSPRRATPSRRPPTGAALPAARSGTRAASCPSQPGGTGGSPTHQIELKQ